MAALSMFSIDNPSTMPPTIGKIIVSKQINNDMMIASERIAPSQLGRCFPFIAIFCHPFIIGLAKSETTTDMRIYTKTLLKNQQRIAIMQKIAANKVYFARRSVYFSDSILKNILLVPFFGTRWVYLCINKQK